MVIGNARSATSVSPLIRIGIKRLAVPEIEIREYLTYRFARQSSLQLRYNNWDDTFGFRDEPRNQDFGEFVRDAQTLERWSLTDEHLTLGRGILPEEVGNKKWKPIVNEWLDVLPQLMGLVQTQDDKVWINEIDKLMARAANAPKRLADTAAALKLSDKAKWIHVELWAPETTPFDAFGGKADVVRHRNAGVLVDKGATPELAVFGVMAVRVVPVVLVGVVAMRR